jgi:hypothetical protein
MFESANKRIKAFHDIPDDLFTLKPDSKNWSAAEICSHITKFNTMYIDKIEIAADNHAQISRSTEPLFRPGYFYRMYAKSMEPPYTVKLKTLRPFYPSTHELEKQDTISLLINTQQTLLDHSQQFKNNKLDLDITRGKNPLLQFLTMSITDFLVLLDAHQRRHFWQLEQTLLKLSGKSYKPVE